MKTKQELLNIFKAQLAIEYNCSIKDLSSSENIITTQKNDPRRRHYINGTFFFQMVTFGDNIVITADERIHGWLKEYTKEKMGHWLFEHKNIIHIEEALNQYGKKLFSTHHMFISYKQAEPRALDITTKWFELEEIHQFYESKKFPNAIGKDVNPKRPDVLAVVAYDGETIMGMAGCSADTPLLWQIGIDVDPQYRGRGIGTYLVCLLKKEIERRDKIPFYGTSLSNLHSWGIALNSGFSPAWVEIATIEE